MPATKVLTALAFQVVWIVTALAAARGLSWPGVAAAGALILYHLASTRHRLRTLGLVAACAAIGALCESALAASGIIRYAAGWPNLPTLAPLWLMALWAAFATTLPALRALLGGWPRILLPALGAGLGLLSYLAGERLGALAFTEPRVPGYVAVALSWAGALPLLLALEDLFASAGRSD